MRGSGNPLGHDLAVSFFVAPGDGRLRFKSGALRALVEMTDEPH